MGAHTTCRQFVDQISYTPQISLVTMQLTKNSLAFLSLVSVDGAKILDLYVRTLSNPDGRGYKITIDGENMVRSIARIVPKVTAVTGKPLKDEKHHTFFSLVQINDVTFTQCLIEISPSGYCVRATAAGSRELRVPLYHYRSL